MFLVIKNATAQELVRKGRQFAIRQGIALFFLSVRKRQDSGVRGTNPTKCMTPSKNG
ncbi:hypothetical protein LOY64_02020 [Pseudomonas corrugata]|uniref:Uncharacterized protein n=1 Tax=Pseudomonas corrugata TaxID=47879 RepID=A0A8B6UZ33_9PSED|nr:hypothetical protein [Pseudomonas corrugata]MDU9021470.1 hypothetical protein [Pseudomonas corrugata]MDU9033436.1 hypothetical protein [Pseudomonas corrugata]MDU9034552.1 hypothetical protein [Pseudomonas corrugata]MDU9039479.1 hypothetical protein [Pseudomonas corrugata]QTH17160.1 hypothetical protein C4C32_01925 [Pseudomonas corrugata]